MDMLSTGYCVLSLVTRTVISTVQFEECGSYLLSYVINLGLGCVEMCIKINISLHLGYECDSSIVLYVFII